MPEFPKFGQEQYDLSNSAGCADQSCNINYIINRPVVTVSDGGGCCDCPPGPQGPPGPPGARGEAGESSCPNFYAGPLLPEETPIDEQAFQDLLESKGYIVQLNTGDGLYTQAEVDADIVTYPDGEISYIRSATGQIGTGLTSNTEDLYPMAYETIGANGVSYYNHTPTFGQFLEMCGLRDGTGTTEQRKNFYKTGNNRQQIPSLLNCNNAPSGSNAPVGVVSRVYTFVSRDSSATSGVNGPYLLEQFKNNVQGIMDGTVRSDTFQTDNPASLTNLGHQIVKEDGSIGVAYDCEDCIQGPPDSNRLETLDNLGSCDYFVDTENGVLYTRDGNWPTNAPKFNENGIPLRRKPDIELPPPTPRSIGGVLLKITTNTEFDVPENPSPKAFRWKYAFDIVRFNPANDSFTVVRSSTPNEYALNGCEVFNDLDGIGSGQFVNFPNAPTQFEMLPIRTGTIVLAKKESGKYIFSIPNAYKAGCE